MVLEGYFRIKKNPPHTAGKFSIMPGSKGFSTIKITAKLKVTPGAALWPAFWLLPQTTMSSRCSGCGRYGVWASSGEIDIFEAANEMNSVAGTIHFGQPWPGNHYISNRLHSFQPVDTWHIVSLIWRRDQMEWFMDGEKFGEARSAGGNPFQGGWYSSGEGAGSNAPFDVPFHLLVNLAVGGGFTGGVSPETAAETLQEPKSMNVDWIRVYGRS